MYFNIQGIELSSMQLQYFIHFIVVLVLCRGQIRSCPFVEFCLLSSYN